MIELDRYRRLFSLHRWLRDDYGRWEQQLNSSNVCNPGAIVGFWGHETDSPPIPVLWFGHILRTDYIGKPDTRMPLQNSNTGADESDHCRIAGVDIRTAVWILLESGHDIRLVPLGCIAFVAVPMFDGKWHVAVRPEFESLFSKEPSFGSLPRWAYRTLDPASDFQDPALSALHQFVSKYGISSLSDASRVKAIIRDLAPAPSWCAPVIAQAIELGIVERLRDENQAYSLLRPILVRRLHDYGPAEERAEWAIDRLAIVTGRYTAREMLWYKLNNCSIGIYKIRAGTQQTYSAAEVINGYATAHVVDLVDCERLEPGLWPVDVPLPPGMDEATKDEEFQDGLTAVRVRDDANRLLFTWLFENDQAAHLAIRSLRTFHTNRCRLTDWVRDIVTELSPRGDDRFLIDSIAAACSDDIPVVIGFYPRDNEKLHAMLIATLRELAPRFADRCRFRAMAASREQIEEQLLEDQADDSVHLPFIGGFYRGELIDSNNGNLGLDSLCETVEAVLRRKETLDRTAHGSAWRCIQPDGDPKRIVTTAFGKTWDDLGLTDDEVTARINDERLTENEVTALINDLKAEALAGKWQSIIGLLTHSPTVAQETIAALCLTLSEVKEQVAVILAPADGIVWQRLVPTPLLHSHSVLFKLSSWYDEDERDADGVLFCDRSTESGGEFISTLRGETEVPWEFVSPCTSSEQLRHCAEYEYVDKSAAALAREHLRARSAREFLCLAQGGTEAQWQANLCCNSSEQLQAYAEYKYADESLAALVREELRARHEADIARRIEAAKTALVDHCIISAEFGSLMFSIAGTSWEQLMSYVKDAGERKLILFCRDGDEWRRLASEGDLAQRLDLVVFTGDDRLHLIGWLREALGRYNYLPHEPPVLLAFDQELIDCAAQCYQPRYGAGDWAEQVEKVYDCASPFRKWRGGTLRDLNELVDSLEKQLPTQADEHAERELWEQQLQEAGTWNEYKRQKLGIVEEWLSTKAIKRGLDRQQWPAESTVGAYFARCLPKLRAQIGR
jgi:hypothetical protein